MLDPFDFKEPSCLLCKGKDFYYPDKNKPVDRIPVKRIIDKLDELFSRNDLDQAERLLNYWQSEAQSFHDKEGELSIVNELVGLYRKTMNKEKAIESCEKALELIKILGIEKSVSSATIILNSATTLKAFGQATKALPLYDMAYEIYREKLPSDDVKMAAFFNNKALCLSDLKDYENAEKCFFSAIEIMKKAENGKLDEAITYVNLAHLYEDTKKEKSYITDCLFKAYSLINDESIPEDGYYAFVLSKCAPSFDHFGYTVIAKELKNTSEKIYART